MSGANGGKRDIQGRASADSRPLTLKIACCRLSRHTRRVRNEAEKYRKTRVQEALKAAPLIRIGSIGNLGRYPGSTSWKNTRFVRIVKVMSLAKWNWSAVEARRMIDALPFRLVAAYDRLRLAAYREHGRAAGHSDRVRRGVVLPAI